MKTTEFGAPGEAIGLQQTLQNAPPCKRLATIQMAMYILSFGLTWYLVWWDSLIGFAVAVWGYYMLLNEYTRPTVKHVEIYHYGSIMSMVSHAIAVSVVIYYLIQSHLLDTLELSTLTVQIMPRAYYAFLLIYLFIQMAVTTVAIQRSYVLCAELARNDYYFEHTNKQFD
uniref:AlNc14C4G539 protein n=1 Tax=Albugo laibachii Nc14 TaxID=890382 RepID=F0W097_9STRA|nr:AlNc14C4G539 [Albugo laibachii Nc14]|eukprot:CCA14468.1 AlNc14C4G539 [Albugo laibachii Nc14]